MHCSAVVIGAIGVSIGGIQSYKAKEGRVKKTISSRYQICFKCLIFS